jgi:hypothetical protein
MTSEDAHAEGLRPGMAVVALNGERLGIVREVQANYLLVDQEDAHNDLDVPANAVDGVVGEEVRLTVNRTALTEVDHEETVHHEHGDPGS